MTYSTTRRSCRGDACVALFSSTASHRKTHPMVTGEHKKYPHLFTPFKIRDFTIGNRIVISAHFAGWWVDAGLPSKEFTAYLEERAKGGVGLFVIGATSPSPGSGWLENTSDNI